MFRNIKQDFYVNRGNHKGMVIVLSYRISSYIKNNNYLLIRVLGYPFLKLYSFIFTWIMGVEIPAKTKIGEGLQIWHGVGIIINVKTIIGKNCVLRHTTTIGNKYGGGESPVIGDNVNIGAHSIIIGDIKVGDNVTIGAGSIITKSIPDNAIVYGNPLKIKFKGN